MVDKNKNKKYNYAIFLSVAVFLGLIISYFLIISPLYKKSKSITDEVKAKQENLTKLKDKKAKLIVLKEKEEQLKEDAKRVEAALPDNAAVGRLFIQINELAKISNGSVNSVTGGGNTAETVETAGQISKISFNIPATYKSYFDLKDFIGKSETALRLFDINSLAVSNSAAGETVATFSANTFVRK